jgi:hypothetical protein
LVYEDRNRFEEDWINVEYKLNQGINKMTWYYYKNDNSADTRNLKLELRVIS